MGRYGVQGVRQGEGVSEAHPWRLRGYDWHELCRLGRHTWHAEKGWSGTQEPLGPLTQAVPRCPSQVCSFHPTTPPGPCLYLRD